MKTLTEHALKKIKELGDKAPEYFGKKQSTIDTWIKTGRVSADAIEKVYAENPIMPSGTTIEQEKKGADEERIDKIEAAANNANEGVKQIVKHINSDTNPALGRLQEEIKLLATFNTALNALIGKVERLENIRPQGVSTAPTLGQLVSAQQFERDPGVSLTRPSATTLATFNEPVLNSAHPLDSGIAPTAEEVQEQNEIRASGGDPAQTGTNKPAGPATEPPSANYRNWTAPAPPRR